MIRPNNLRLELASLDPALCTRTGNTGCSVRFGIAGDAERLQRQQQASIVGREQDKPGSGAVDKRQRNAGEATRARRRDEFAVDALGKCALHAGHLAGRALRARAQGRELLIERLRVLAVLEGER